MTEDENTDDAARLDKKFVMVKETDSRPEVLPTGREAASHHNPNLI